MTTSLTIPTKQSAASTARQGGALAGLLASFSGNLPSVPGVSPTVVWVTTVVVSGVLFVVEHFVSDPSTGTTQGAIQ